MNEQPEALRLADWLARFSGDSDNCRDAAAELRHQHALIEEMRAVLREIRDNGPSRDVAYDRVFSEAKDQQ